MSVKNSLTTRWTNTLVDYVRYRGGNYIVVGSFFGMCFCGIITA